MVYFLRIGPCAKWLLCMLQFNLYNLSVMSTNVIPITRMRKTEVQRVSVILVIRSTDSESRFLGYSS